MPRPSIADRYKYLTTGDVCQSLGITIEQLKLRLRDGALPPPTQTNCHGLRLFDEQWLRVARALMENSREK